MVPPSLAEDGTKKQFLIRVTQDSYLDQYFLRNAHKLGPKFPYFDKIYQFGASKADTGNLIRESPSGSTLCARFPYGETFFMNATGRCSNGLLIIDYTALSAGLPFLKPYKEIGADFSNGVNFAVTGATALPVETLAAMNISSPYTPTSLHVQLDWMASFFNSTCHSNTECAEKNANSLFMLGEIGSNDYNYALFQRKSIQEAKQMVPQVVGAIANGVRRVIQFGATRVVVPGNFPVGCFPFYLTGFETNDSTAYDEQFHCLKDINNLSIYHNEYLQQAIDELKIQNPKTTIIYADYYNAFLWILSKAQLLGFDVNSVQKACCGIGVFSDEPAEFVSSSPSVLDIERDFGD
ncbi:GDSL esterase/lipase [Forsythia ovata]|uniref:GDSL esterase/lipase n=1 Tax=Forsythia ovata TaxID=205694 RepID=A0ABD1PXD2_9LAMI